MNTFKFMYSHYYICYARLFLHQTKAWRPFQVHWVKTVCLVSLKTGSSSHGGGTFGLRCIDGFLRKNSGIDLVWYDTSAKTSFELTD